MSELYLKWMDRLYLLAMAIAGLSLLVMTIVIPIGIFSRYVLNRGESWPEPIAIICMVTFTFIGAAVSYRAGSHIAVNMLTDRLPDSMKTVCARVVDLLMLVISGIMFWYSYLLCIELWDQPVAGRAAPEAATAEEISAARRDRRMDIGEAPDMNGDANAAASPGQGAIPHSPRSSRRMPGGSGDFTNPTPPAATFADAPARPPRSGRG